MRLPKLSLVIAVGCALTTGAMAQTTNDPLTQGTTTPGSIGAGTVAGSLTTTDTVVVPGAVVLTPGVAAIDTTTSATVGSTISASDRALLESIVSALSSDPALRGARLNVTVTAGLVRITGTALDSGQADRARAVAASVAGGARVEAEIASG